MNFIEAMYFKAKIVQQLSKIFLSLCCFLFVIDFMPLQAQNLNDSTMESQKKQEFLDWQTAYNLYEKSASEYWQQIANKRKIRIKKRTKNQTITLNDYVLTQPLIYTGPAKPLEQSSLEKPDKPFIPTAKDLIQAAMRVYDFAPEQPKNEAEFMQAYVEAAKKLGFTREQIVSIYAFETGGEGRYDLQAGMLKGLDSTPISTAMGYNQLVATASVSLMWEFGHDIAKELKHRAQYAKPEEKQALLAKVEIVNRMTAMAKTVPHIWKEQAKLAKTDAGLAMHAMLLDKDIGPLLQIYKLKTTLNFLKYKGVKRQLSGAELEILNLTGDGNGYDMITLPPELQDKVPTSNFFVRVGYERNTIAQRHNTVAQLLDATRVKIQEFMKKQGTQMLYQIF